MITDQEVVAVLRKISVYDKRKPDQFELDEFAVQAARNWWTYPEAVEAVEAFYSVPRHGERIGPGDVTAHIKAARRQPKPLGTVLALEGPAPAGAEHRAACLAEIRGILAKRGGAK